MSAVDDQNKHFSDNLDLNSRLSLAPFLTLLG